MPKGVIYLRSAYDRAESIFSHGERMCRQKATDLGVPEVRIFAECASGLTDERPKLREALDSLEAGDVFISVDSDMIARDTGAAARIRGRVDAEAAKLVTVF